MDKAMWLQSEFAKIFGDSDSDVRVYASPGRVNLIGEHTDYNGGMVFPAALELNCHMAIRPRTDRVMRLWATDIKRMVTVDLDRLDEAKTLAWGNYQAGVADQLQKAGYTLAGCDCLCHDEVPLGSGLSSSAAIEVVTALALLGASEQRFGKKTHLDKVALAKLCQRAENRFVGVQCGIMDQFASVMGKKNHAIALNCKDLSYEMIELVMEQHAIVIVNTNKKRSLTTGKYNERRSECDQAFFLLKPHMPHIECLGDVTCDEFGQFKKHIKDPVIAKRAEHVISENERVRASVRALEQKNMTAFGDYMKQSHISLRDDYEVTGRELDTLFDIAIKIEGVLGSRMTGAGFGGCTVSLVRTDILDRFTNIVTREYEKRIGYEPTVIVTAAGEGGRRLA